MRISIAQKEQLYNEFGKLLKAGFPITQVITAIVEGRPPKTHRIYAESLQSSLRDGATIAEAIESVPLDGLEPMESKLIEAGERGGCLDKAYLGLAEHYALLRKTLTSVRAKMIYPLLLLHVGILLPSIPKGLLKGDMAASLKAALVILGLAYVVAIAGFFFYRAFTKLAATSAPADRILGIVPFLGKLRKRLALSRFASVFRLNLLAGFTISKSLRNSSDCSQSGVVREMGRELEPKVAAGNPLGPMLLEESGFPKDFARSIATAEKAGALDDEMERWSIRFQEDARDSAEATAQWFPLLCYFVIVGIVAWQIISVFTTYTGVLSDMLDAI